MKFLVSVFSFALFSANAATWYVDSSVSSSGNGTSWGAAWKALSNISGVKAGDTVYISGGPSGSSQTYSVSSWSPAGGAAGNPITYQIGQDSSHNGTATFSGSGTWFGGANNAIISGNAGDGKMHFSCSGYNTAASINGDSNLRISYVNLGNGLGDGIDGQSVNNFELDHCYAYISSANADHFMSVGLNGTTWDQNLIHDNAIYCPHLSSNANGADFFQIGGNGYSLYNNLLVGYSMSYTGNQHQDGWQGLGNSYIKIYGNTFIGIQNYSVFGDAYYGGFTHIWIYNNVFIGCVGPVFGTDGGYNGPSPCTFNDIVIANNTCDYTDSGGDPIALNNTTSFSTTFTSCVVANNAIINGAGVATQGNSSSTVVNNVVISKTQAAVDFISYLAGTTNSNLHLLVAATALIGKGANESSYFTIDKDGNSRPASGAWDVGAYAYGSAPANPVISVSPTSLNFVSLNSATVTNTITVRNTGGGTLSGTASIAAPFQIIAGGTYSLAANQSQTVTVTFKPNGGSANGTIAFTGGGGASVSVQGSISSYPPPTVSAIAQNGADVDLNVAGLQIFAGSIVQYSGSASDPNGLPLTWQWIYTVNGGAETVAQSGSGTVTSVNFNYTTATIGNTYVWKLRVNNGYGTAESDLTIGVEAPPVGNVIQATAGTINSPFVVTGNYISQSVQTTTPTTGGSAYYNFTITNAGNYVIQALVNAPNDAANSLYVNIDGAPQDPTMIWDIPLTASFEQRIISWRGNGTDTSNQFIPKVFNLTAGVHQLVVCGREANVQLQTFAILQIPLPPQNLRIVGP